MREDIILISGARAPISLELARSFKKKGYKVIMIDSFNFTISRWSNAITKYYKVPSPRFQTNAFIEKIQFIITQEKITHFIPTCEEALFISQHKEKFKCCVWVSNFETMLALHNKEQFFLKNHHHFPIPDTINLSNFNDWEFSKDYVFKPIYSRFGSATKINQNLNSQSFLESEKKNWIAQKKIDGVEICVYSIWENGLLKAYAAYQPIYRAGKGAGIFFQPVDNPVVYEQTNFIGEKLNYTGQLSFDVIISEKDNSPFFIECNPRGTSGAHLINDALADAFLKNLKQPKNNQNYSIKYALFLLHFRSFFSKKCRESKDVIFKWDDLKPFFFQVISLFEITYIKFRYKKSWLEATTGDIEWNGYED